MTERASTEPALNPYASPAAVNESSGSRVEHFPIPRSQPHWAFVRWFFICYACAAPSFFLGSGFGSSSVRYAGMTCGILVFVLLYTAAECSDALRRWRAKPGVERTLAIGFGLRVAISLIFPIGLYLDMFLGLFAVGLSNRLGFPVERRGFGSAWVEFANFFVTTLVQGGLVNLVLFGFMLLMYAVQIPVLKSKVAGGSEPRD